MYEDDEHNEVYEVEGYYRGCVDADEECEDGSTLHENGVDYIGYCCDKDECNNAIKRTVNWSYLLLVAVLAVCKTVYF